MRGELHDLCQSPEVDRTIARAGSQPSAICSQFVDDDERGEDRLEGDHRHGQDERDEGMPVGHG